MSCEQIQLVHRYFDGEVSQGERARVEGHLRECGECGLVLAELRKLSARLKTAPAVEISPIAMERLRGAWKQRGERSILRLASGLTGLAAMVMVGVLLMQTGGGPAQAAAGPANWESAAVRGVGDIRDDGSADTQMAQWMLEGVGSVASGQ